MPGTCPDKASNILAGNNLKKPPNITATETKNKKLERAAADRGRYLLHSKQETRSVFSNQKLSPTRLLAAAISLMK